jgi:hypothetical protein
LRLSRLVLYGPDVEGLQIADDSGHGVSRRSIL